MTTNTYIYNEKKIAEVLSDEIIISKSEDALDILGNIYYEGFDKLVIYEKNITPDFFDLKTGLAGEIIQKFLTYRVDLIIVGEFSNYPSQSLKDFIFECNKDKKINFVRPDSELIEFISNRK